MNASKHSKKKSIAIFRLLLVLLFLISSGYLIGRSIKKQQLPEVHTASQDVIILFSTSLDQISSVAIDPGNGGEYTLSVTNDDLVLESDPGFPIRSSIVSLIKNNICLIRAENTVIDLNDERTSPAFFGFDPYKCKAVITATDGSVHTVLIGNQIAGGIPYYYFMFDDNRCIYSGSTDMYNAFSNDLSLLHPVAEIHINTDILERIDLTGCASFSMEYKDMNWQMEVPFSYPLDDTFVSGYLKNLSQLSFSQYLGPSDKAEDNEYGLDDPYLKIDVKLAKSFITVPNETGNPISIPVPESHVTITIGNQYDNLFRFAEYDGSIYMISYYFINALTDFDILSAVKSNPFQTALSSINRIRVVQSLKEKEYLLYFPEAKDEFGNNRYDENGNQIYDLLVKDSNNGSMIDADQFAAWYLQLQSIKVLYALPDRVSYNEKAEPVVEVYLTSQLHERQISFYTFSGSQLLMSVDGSCLFCTDIAVLDYFNDTP